MKISFSAVKATAAFCALIAAYSWACGEGFEAERKAAEATSNAIHIEKLDAADRRREQQMMQLVAADTSE